jgi:hypothetical protein
MLEGTILRQRQWLSAQGNPQPSFPHCSAWLTGAYIDRRK